MKLHYTSTIHVRTALLYDISLSIIYHLTAFHWPGRSHDMNPLDLYVCGHINSVLYATPLNDVMELQQKVIAICEDIRKRNGVFERV
jgi:hypothetical protein